MKMESFYIIANAGRDTELKVTGKVEDFLRSQGKSVRSHCSSRYVNGIYTDEDAIPEDTDCVIVIGGDGTLIQAAHDIADRELPLLGINLGKLGFLADVEPDDIEASLTALVEGRFKIDDRMMLCGVVNTEDDQVRAESRALNDIVIHRSGGMRVVDYKVYVNDSYLACFRADGVIVCTPTGSTGYSLSAGGPIVEPMSRMMVITPICSHMMNSRSIVLSADDHVRIVTTESNVDVTFDGRRTEPLEKGESVLVRKSGRVTRIVRVSDDSFLSVLHNKFGGSI